MPGKQPSLVLRRFEIAISHEAAFLFWGIKGVLAERWAHGPHFTAYGDHPNQLTLTDVPSMNRQAKKQAIAGIVVSSFIWEAPPARKDAQDLATEWIHDVLEAATPRSVNKLFLRFIYARSIVDLKRVQT